MKKIKLGDLIIIDSGYAFKANLFNNDKNGIPVIRIRDVSSGNISTYYSGEYDRKYIVNNDDLLIGMDGNFTIRKWSRGEALLNQRVCRVKSNNLDKILDEYIYWILPVELKKIEDKTSFVTVKHLSVKDINQIEISLQDINMQQKIVSLLDKSQELINKRREQIECLYELVKSRFIEMFGDPALNPKGWEKGKIADIVIKTQYGTGSKADEQNGEFKVLRMNNITYNGQWDFSSMKYVDLEEKEQQKYLVYKGEILFNRTNSKELVGKTAVYKEDEPMAYAGYLVKAIPNERATGEFIAAYMNTKYVKSKLFNMAKNIVGMANINAEEFKKIDVYIPPVELQNEYIRFVEQVDKLKFEMENSLKELENNFNSLMNKAFSGELFNEV